MADLPLVGTNELGLEVDEDEDAIKTEYRTLKSSEEQRQKMKTSQQTTNYLTPKTNSGSCVNGGMTTKSRSRSVALILY